MRIRKTAEKGNAAQAEDAPMYEVVMQDEYDNLYQLGFYESLDDAIDDINGFLGAYEDDGVVPLKKGDLAEYASTFGACFDRPVEWENEDDCPGCIMVRGFILSAKSVGEEAGKALAVHARAAKEGEEQK